MAYVTYERENRIGRITLNRPERLNAFSNEMIIDLAAALKEFDLDDAVSVGLVVGSGRAFSSGADVKSRHQLPPQELARTGGPGGLYGAPHVGDVALRSLNNKPMVAAVHGYAIGAGLFLALACEVIVASRDASFQVAETVRGLQSISFLRAMQLRGAGTLGNEVCLTGRSFGAPEAFQHGLINRLCDQDSMEKTALDLAEQIAAMPPLGLRATVRHRRHQLAEVVAAARYEADPLRLYLTDDFRSSGQAFLHRTSTPEFRGE